MSDMKITSADVGEMIQPLELVRERNIEWTVEHDESLTSLMNQDEDACVRRTFLQRAVRNLIPQTGPEIVPWLLAYDIPFPTSKEQSEALGVLSSHTFWRSLEGQAAHIKCVPLTMRLIAIRTAITASYRKWYDGCSHKVRRKLPHPMNVVGWR